MYTSSLITLMLLAAGSLAGPIQLESRQARPCFLVGNTALPKETSDVANSIAGSITCDAAVKTLSGVPDVISNGIKFSSVNFATSSQSPLQFALTKFATANNLASTDLAKFENELAVYLATEAGIRSAGGNLAIKVPKFFLAFQVARIKTAKGVPNPEPGQQVLHLRDKVLKNAAGESAALLAQVNALAAKLS